MNVTIKVYSNLINMLIVLQVFLIEVTLSTNLREEFMLTDSSDGGLSSFQLNQRDSHELAQS